MRNLKFGPKLTFWILIFFFIQDSDTQNTTYCYNDLDFCVECGCFPMNLTEHTLSCGENEVIRLELDNNKQTIKSLPLNLNGQTCDLTSPDICKNGFNEKATTTFVDRVELYRNCTLQNTCTITVDPVDGGDVKIVRYPYVCENNIQDISTAFLRTLSNPVFYFKGLDYISKTIHCDCSVYKSSGNLSVEIFYLYGDNICNKFYLLSNTRLINCTNGNVQLYTTKKDIHSNFLRIEIRNMTVIGDEVIFFKVHGENLDVTCTGWSDNLLSASTSPIMLSPSHSSSTTSVSTTNRSHDSSNQNINEAEVISKTEHEKKLKETYTLFGGIIAAIIIIVLLAIGIYCFIRKRRGFIKNKNEQQPAIPQQPVSQQQPVSAQPPVAQQQLVLPQQQASPQQSDSPQGNGGIYSHYNYVDLDLPNDTNTEPVTSKLKHTPGADPSQKTTAQAGVAQNPKGDGIETISTASPNHYSEIEADTQDESTTASKTSGNIFSLQKPEEKMQSKKSIELYSEPIEFNNQNTVQQERKDVNSSPTIVSNTDDLTEDTYNHIGDTNKPNVARDRVLSESHVKPIAKLKPIRYNHNPTDDVPTSTATLNENQSKNPINPRVKLNPSTDNYSHVKNVGIRVLPRSNQSNFDHTDDKTQPEPRTQDKSPQPTDSPTADNYSHVVNVGIRVLPRSNQSNFDHIDDSFVIMDSPVDREDTFSHIQDKPNMATSQPAPITQDKSPQPTNSPTADNYSHVVNVGTRAPRSIQSNYDHIDDSFVIMDSSVDREDTYSHIQDKPRVTTPQSAPQSAYSPVNGDFYENVHLEQKVKADNSVRDTSLYNDENEDTYNHLENSNNEKL